MENCKEPSGLNRILDWLRLRVRQPSTWVGLGMIAIVMGSDPTQTESIVQALSLIVGGGLVAAGRPKGEGTKQ